MSGEAEQRAKTIIEGILNAMAIPFDSIEDFSDDQGLRFNITTKSSSILIGHRGEHVSALNHIIKRAMSRNDENVRVSIDVNGYLEESNQTLRNKVKILAERAKSFKTSVDLEPMSPYERMVIHAFLASDPHIETESKGVGRKRYVVIRYKEA